MTRSLSEDSEPLLQALGMKDFLGAEVDFEGDDERVIYHFALALVPGSIAEDDARAAGLLGKGRWRPGSGPTTGRPASSR